MTAADALEAWGRGGRAYRRFTATAERLLDRDPALGRALSAWTAFVVESHGDVFARMDAERPRERLFVDALYYDFVVDGLLTAAEETLGFEVTNPGPRGPADALDVDFGSLGSKVADAASVSGPAATDLDREDLLDAGVSDLRALYESVLAREARLALGEYNTPRGVAELAVEQLDVGAPTETFLDPGCGSGVFLAAAIDRKREALAGERAPADVVDAVTESVLGIDLNPVTVESAKLGYVLALGPELAAADAPEVEVPVFLGDALALTREDPLAVDEFGTERARADQSGTFAVDHLVGNPPWTTWADLTDRLKDAWRDTYVESLDLFPHGGAAARLGHGNDDVSVQFALVCVRRYLRAGGDAAFVLKRDAMKGPAGTLLRSQRVGDRSVAVRSVQDFTDLRPFGDQVDAGAAVYALSADDDPEFPIRATAWTRESGSGARETDAPAFSSADAMRASLARAETSLVPVEPDDPTSAWVRRDAERRALGDCHHEIRHGLKDDAKDVFSVEAGDLAALDADLVYPYLRSKHVVKYGLFGHDRHLVPMARAGEDNEDELRSRYPDTYDYLARHRDRLEARGSSWLDRGPFYSLFGLGEYTWADYKVVWCRLGFKPHFAVVSTVADPELGERPVVPGDHCMFVACEDEHEAHFLTALLNSAPYQTCLRDLASEGKASLSKSVVSKLALPAYRGTPDQRRLADLSMAAHDIVPEHVDVSKREYNRTTIDELAAVQAEIDDLVEELLADGVLSPDETG
ncbi:N-6 DNA methylase [Halorussus halobius]|uniref:N-6 DNA methylase n=2 Tax=Halorussus halobius TaxID=1710537 RepID=UPI00109235F7|nr:N-6 DNA methylase [Halorussus halobius]